MVRGEAGLSAASRAAARAPAPNHLCCGGWQGALSAAHRTRMLPAESPLYLWAFTQVLSCVWTGVFVLCGMRFALVLLNLSCVHLKLPVFFVSVARGSRTVTFCWGKRKRNYKVCVILMEATCLVLASLNSVSQVISTCQNHSSEPLSLDNSLP